MERGHLDPCQEQQDEQGQQRGHQRPERDESPETRRQAGRAEVAAERESDLDLRGQNQDGQGEQHDPAAQRKANGAEQPQDGLSGNHGECGADLSAPARVGGRAQAGYSEDAGGNHQLPESNAVA